MLNIMLIEAKELLVKSWAYLTFVLSVWSVEESCRVFPWVADSSPRPALFPPLKCIASLTLIQFIFFTLFIYYSHDPTDLAHQMRMSTNFLPRPTTRISWDTMIYLIISWYADLYESTDLEWVNCPLGSIFVPWGDMSAIPEGEVRKGSDGWERGRSLFLHNRAFWRRRRCIWKQRLMKRILYHSSTQWNATLFSESDSSESVSYLIFIAPVGRNISWIISQFPTIDYGFTHFEH